MTVRTQKNNIMRMWLIISTELMFFMGLISAYLVSRAGATFWPPAQQPRLPVESTAINTVLLVLSLITLFFGIRSEKNKSKNADLYFLVTLLLGTFFVLLQGREWVELINFGLTTSSSNYGAFFYLIVGAHGLHVMAGLMMLTFAWAISKKRNENFSRPIVYFWGFVVLLWPLLYWLVYFN